MAENFLERWQRVIDKMPLRMPPKLSAMQRVARELCRAVTDDCVMDADRDRELCTAESCRMMRIAERAIQDARLKIGE